MNNLKVSSIVNKSWDTFKANAGILIGLLVITTLISYFFSFINQILVMFIPEPELAIVITVVLALVSSLINSMISLGNTKAYLKLANDGKTSINYLFSCFKGKLILHYFMGAIMITPIILLGSIFFIIPGIYLSIRLFMFPLILLEQEDPNCFDACAKSWAMTDGHVWDIFVIHLVAGLIALCGVLLCFIGLIAAAPICGLMYVYIYTTIRDKYNNNNPVHGQIQSDSEYVHNV